MKVCLFAILIYLCSFHLLFAKEYPLIERLVVTKNSIAVTPGKHFQMQFLYKGDYYIEYYDPDIDLRQFDESILIMPFIFDVLASILISPDTYYVNSLDSEICQSLERFRKAFQIMYPNTKWEGKLTCKKKIEHVFNFDSNRILTLFSGGVDSTYSLLSNLDKSQILFTLKGHVDSRSAKQWEETNNIAHRFACLFNYPLTTAFSTGVYLVNRQAHLAFSPDIYDWGIQAVGDLRWMGKAIPLLIHYKASMLCIPASVTWNYPLKSMTNAVIKKAFCFGNCLRVYSDGFDVSRTQKTAYIAQALAQLFPNEKWNLKVCFSEDGKNCGHCRKCLRTINDLYVMNANPKDFGFNTSEEEAKANLIQCLSEITNETKIHQEVEAYFFNGLLMFIEQNPNLCLSPYTTWLYNLLIGQEFISDIRNRNSSYYKNLQIECEKAWQNYTEMN